MDSINTNHFHLESPETVNELQLLKLIDDSIHLPHATMMPMNETVHLDALVSKLKSQSFSHHIKAN